MCAEVPSAVHAGHTAQKTIDTLAPGSMLLVDVDHLHRVPGRVICMGARLIALNQREGGGGNLPLLGGGGGILAATGADTLD